MLRAAAVLPFLPLAANSFGWIFTEMGRQPWLVFGLMPTASGITPGSTAGSVFATLSAFTVLYAGLTWLWIWLLVKHARPGLPDVSAEANWGRRRTPDGGSGGGDHGPGGDDADRPLMFAY
jgi:cytochrome d ubiquinol oxidase subunit I